MTGSIPTQPSREQPNYQTSPFTRLRFTGTLIHDCWASYFSYDTCRHGLCGSHLLRELAFIIESNSYRWARLMKKLLCEACHRVNTSETKTLSEAEYRAIRKRYRTILTQGAGELPEIPKRKKGQRGRIAKSDAHNLHERLKKYEDAVLRFIHDPDVSFTNNAAERAFRMAKVKMKVSGCFRTRVYAETGAESQATCNQWPQWVTIHSSPSRSRLQDGPQRWSSK